MNSPLKGKKFLLNKVYCKNNKARGQTLQISKKFNKNKTLNNVRNTFLNKNKKSNTNKDSLLTSTERNILEEIKNTKYKIEQYENYLKKSLQQKMTFDARRKVMSHLKINENKSLFDNKEYNSSQPININNLFNSFNKSYNNYNNYNNIKKNQPQPNISLINNKLIFNYMNTIDNNNAFTNTYNKILNNLSY